MSGGHQPSFPKKRKQPLPRWRSLHWGMAALFIGRLVAKHNQSLFKTPDMLCFKIFTKTLMHLQIDQQPLHEVRSSSSDEDIGCFLSVYIRFRLFVFANNIQEQLFTPHWTSEYKRWSFRLPTNGSTSCLARTALPCRPIVCRPDQNCVWCVQILDFGIILSKKLSNPKHGHTTGGSVRGARRSGQAGSGKIGCQQNNSPRKQKSTVPSKKSKK